MQRGSVPSLLCKSISIHALLAESDAFLFGFFLNFSKFLSTLSLRRATPQQRISARRVRYFYPRSPCGERLVDTQNLCVCVIISIHALLAESDGIIDIINNVINDFYPRSPCGERLISIALLILPIRFLSTLSLRRATQTAKANRKEKEYFYPRSPCGERQ